MEACEAAHQLHWGLFSVSRHISNSVSCCFWVHTHTQVHSCVCVCRIHRDVCLFHVYWITHSYCFRFAYLLWRIMTVLGSWALYLDLYLLQNRIYLALPQRQIQNGWWSTMEPVKFSLGDRIGCLKGWNKTDFHLCEPFLLLKVTVNVPSLPVFLFSLLYHRSDRVQKHCCLLDFSIPVTPSVLLGNQITPCSEVFT